MQANKLLKSAFIVFPHQLFQNIEILQRADNVYLVEEFLFFNQYKFHKQKLVFHRASMKFYESYLKLNKIKVTYIEAWEANNSVQNLIQHLLKLSITQIHYYEVSDNWLNKRIIETCRTYNIVTVQHNSHSFLNNEKDLQAYFIHKTKYLQNDFYICQRKKLNILIDNQQKPLGGKWSFDAANRLKYPKNKTAPKIFALSINSFYKEAIAYVNCYYCNNYGNISNKFILPTTHSESLEWLNQFLETRFEEFGTYEDAIVDNEHVLHHSVLSPLLNAGLLTPKQLIEVTLTYASTHQIAINSVEGFIRQIIGWREFIRGIYLYKGTQQRNTNFWKFHKKIPESFYKGSTGILPVDVTIKKILETGYCHHIERLMVLGNFMLLCNFHPDSIYQWFMELFIDAYDWVMVPNIYGMSQFADGGLMATKPYISGSSYLLKMSNFKKGNWTEKWDALFWYFLNQHRNFFSANPRLGMLIPVFDKMSVDKKEKIYNIAHNWLNQ
ncbi:cryptochrome/photolyase family protein [Hydrotalea sp.]|uniref:cryptochrome/photolyase family protein n=1 Tax=Hydrotalea sp. TaxID=2881279 RepID=UPI00262DC4D1|nr:cryptochrome/photolyase family protein [Hydrotalea sp.]